MCTERIITWTHELVASLGGVRQQADSLPLLALYEKGEYTSIVRTVKEHLRLDMKLHVAYVNSGGPAETPAWIRLPNRMPAYGTPAFRAMSITVYIRRSFLAEATLPAIVCTIAHELSHVVLDSIGHELRQEEKAVDLAAMILGFRDFYLQETEVRATPVVTPAAMSWLDKLLRRTPPPEVHMHYEVHYFGYLSPEERVVAASLMR